MNKEYNEYDVVYCNECNAIKITEDDRSCLICGNESEKIGFTSKPIQDILKIEKEGEQ